MKKFAQLLVVEFRRIFSNGVVMLIFFGAPLAYGVLVGYTYKSAKVHKLPVGVVDLDASPMADKIIEALDDNENIQVKKVYHTAENLQQHMIDNSFQAIITIPERFGADINQKRYPEINVDLNMANILTVNFASRAIQTVLGTLNAGMEIEGIKKQGVPASISQQRFEAFKTNFNRMYNPGNSYLEFMWPGLMGAVIQQVFFLCLALVFARDFEDKYFAVLAKEHRWSPYFMLLKSVPFILLSVFVWGMAAVLIDSFGIHQNVFNSSMCLLGVLFTTAAMSIGMLCSIIFPTQLKATEFLMVIATPGFILSGYTWPLSEMPSVIQKFAECIPLTHFLEGYRRIALYNGSVSDILPQIKALGAITIFFFILATMLLQWKIWKQRRELRFEKTKG